MKWKVELLRAVRWLHEDSPPPPHPGVREVAADSPTAAADAAATEFRNSGVARPGDWLQVYLPGFAMLHKFRMTTVGVERHV